MATEITLLRFHGADVALMWFASRRERSHAGSGTHDLSSNEASPQRTEPLGELERRHPLFLLKDPIQPPTHSELARAAGAA